MNEVDIRQRLPATFEGLRSPVDPSSVPSPLAVTPGAGNAMSQIDIQAAAKRAAQESKNLLARQLDRQAAAMGSNLSQTARDLEQISARLNERGTISIAADLADRAALYVDRAGRYLQDGNSDRFIGDVEAFSRERPWAVAASAVVLGFVAARIVKSSSARRFAEADRGATPHESRVG